jgi:hypothetical protein
MAHDQDHVTEAVALAHRQCALQDYEHARRPLSGREQPLAAAVLPTFTEPRDTREVSLTELGKRLIAAPGNDVLVWS